MALFRGQKHHNRYEKYTNILGADSQYLLQIIQKVLIVYTDYRRMQTIQSLSLKHKGFPYHLKQIHKPPRELFVIGELPDRPMVAIVGTRKPTPYGREVAYRLAYDLAAAGLTIVSGLAYGVDGIVHRAALDAGGKTVAVLGCGLDVCYPSRHQALTREIVEGRGAVISEYILGTPPLQHHFPARNRIIAGLSEGVVVPEADAKSGSLITARMALEESRIVMAVPGSILSQRSDGPNNLLKAGATPVTSAADVCLALGFTPPTPTAQMTLPLGTAGVILQHLEAEPLPTQSLIEVSGCTPEEVMATLMTLELTGYIRNMGAGVWLRIL